MHISFETLWKEKQSDTGSASEKSLKQWELKYGFQLPTLLKDILLHRNGGECMRAELEIFPLERIEPHPYGDELEEDGNPAASIGNQRIFQFAEHASGGQCLFNYNIVSEGEPAIYLHYSDMDVEMKKQAESFSDFLEQELSVEENPGVDWNMLLEMDVMLHEKAEEVLRHGGSRVTETAFGRYQGKWAVIEEECFGEDRSWSFSTLAGDVDATLVAMSCHSADGRDKCRVSIEPQERDSIQLNRWNRLEDGMWKKTCKSSEFLSFPVSSRQEVQSCLERLLGKDGAVRVIGKFTESQLRIRRAQVVYRELKMIPLEEKKLLRKQWEDLVRKTNPFPPSEADIESANLEEKSKTRLLDYRRFIWNPAQDFFGQNG